MNKDIRWYINEIDTWDFHFDRQIRDLKEEMIMDKTISREKRYLLYNEIRNLTNKPYIISRYTYENTFKIRMLEIVDS